MISFCKRPAPFRGSVVPPLSSALAGALAQIPPLGQPMEQGIECPRADRVTVSAKFFDEAQPVNVFL